MVSGASMAMPLSMAASGSLLFDIQYQSSPCAWLGAHITTFQQTTNMGGPDMTLGSFYCNQLPYTFGCSTWRSPTCLQHQAREHLEQKQGHQYDTILFHKVYRKSACIQGTRDGRRRRSLYLPRYVCMHLRPGGSPLSWLRTNPRRPTLDFPNGKPQSS